MTDSSSLASAVRFSVTDEMRSIAGQQSHHGISIVVTSFLVGAPNKHTYGATSFAQLSTGRLPNGSIAWKSPASRVYGVVDKLRSVSPALCTPNTALLVAHDVAGIPAVKDGVRYHHVDPDATSNSMNRRWEIYSRILREYTFDCVYAIDATDVAVLWMPSCLALPERLVIGSDGASMGVKQWLRKQARMSGLLNSTTAAFHALLHDHTGRMAVRNAGIVGGRRAVFEGALSTVVNRMAGLTEIGDMVAWNEVALTQGDRLITGYPRGPTNLPMYGKLMPEHKCPRLCRHKWLNETRGMYWFGHKLPGSWFKYADYRHCGCRSRCGPLGVSFNRETTDVPFDAPWPAGLSVAARIGHSP